MIFVGYSANSSAYRVWNPATGRVLDAVHVTFSESTPHIVDFGDELLGGEFAPAVPLSRPSSASGLHSSLSADPTLRLLRTRRLVLRVHLARR
jgi:hypothetical protein